MNGKLQKLIECLSKLPGIGPRHATRIVLSLLNWNKDDITQLSQAVLELKDGVRTCRKCHNISEEEECLICKDLRRDYKTVCVVEKVTDLESIEKNGSYKGLYHVLGGTINPLNNVLPQNLNIASLLARVQNYPSEQIEIIIATNPNTYGETTALYLEEQLKPFNIRVTRLGRGLSSGSFLEYADEITLQNAFKNRK